MYKIMDKNINIFTRYIILLLVSLGNLFIFYKIFFLPTFYLSGFFLTIFGKTVLLYKFGTIIFNDVAIEIVNACVAGSAYYLLFILSMSIQNIKIKKRILVILFSFMTLLIINVIRISIMALIVKNPYFDSIHLFVWRIMSIIIVILVWFLSVRIFKIKETPFYLDFKYLLEQVKKSKRKKKHNNTRNKRAKAN